jgi:hypothetical protein
MPASAERVAAEDAPGSEKAPADGAVLLDSLDGVPGTVWGKAARGRQIRGQKALVEADEADEEPPDHV